MKKVFVVIICLITLFTKPAQAQTTIPAWKVTQLKSYIQNTDSILVVNFWATFCKPCNAEIPYYQTIANKYKNKKVKLLLVSLDMKDSYPHQVESFANEHKYTGSIVWLNETNADYFCPMIDKKWSGALPTTYFINKRTGYHKLIEQPLTEKEFEGQLLKAIGK